jgi:hypothetical protein
MAVSHAVPARCLDMSACSFLTVYNYVLLLVGGLFRCTKLGLVVRKNNITNFSEKHPVSVFRAEDQGSMSLRNFGIYVEVHMTSQSIRTTLKSLPWEPQTSTFTRLLWNDNLLLLFFIFWSRCGGIEICVTNILFLKQCSDDAENAWSYTYTPSHACMTWCLLKHQGEL